MAEGNLHAINAVDGWVAGWCAAEGGDEGVWDKAHVHEMVLDGFREIEGDQDCGIADIQFTQNAQSPNSDGLPEGQDPRTRTGMVVIEYTTSEGMAANC